MKETKMTYIEKLCIQAVKAKDSISGIDSKKKNMILKTMAKSILENLDHIVEENKKDIKNAHETNMSSALIDRLTLNKERVEAMAEGLVQVSEYEDPIGKVLSQSTILKGMKLTKISAPMGVIGIIYESRPNVTADAAGLCFKAGSVAILRGGSDAINSNKAIIKALKEAFDAHGVDNNCVQLVEDTSREVARDLMRAKKYVDLLVHRGGAKLIESVMENATIPVIETGTGNCHIYIDEKYDPEYTQAIVENAKCQRPGVCNAIETLLVHEKVYEELLPKIAKDLEKCSVEIRADEKSKKVLPNAKLAQDSDWETEYLDYILAVKVVKNLDEAIEHINKYGTKHSEGIITKIDENIKTFFSRVDAACLYANASTRFTDGGEFGLGAEIGISTQKLHARGPMGANEITTYKYLIEGDGQIR